MFTIIWCVFVGAKEHFNCFKDCSSCQAYLHSFILTLVLNFQVGRHIMESYYEKHESFIDSLFDDFLTQDLPVNLCKILPCDLNTVLSLSIQSRIKGDGSHRQLSSTIKFNIEKSLSQVLTHRCKFIIIERLPSGVFVDPFELEHLLHRAGKSYLNFFCSMIFRFLA